MSEPQRINVLCRPARPSDTDDVMALTKTIWDGGDYIPIVWQDWLADRLGLLAVAEWEGSAVGVGKLTCITPENWWMEGLRTDPQFEGRGIASQLFEYLMNTWLDEARGTLRLTTHYENTPIHHLCDRHGFTLLDEYVPFRAELLPEDSGAFLPVKPGEAGMVLQALQQSPQMASLHGLVDLGWKWCEPDEYFSNEAITTGMAWWWTGSGSEALPGLLLVSRDDDGPGTPVFANICGLSCPPASLHDFLLDFRRLAARQGYAGPGWVLPEQVELRTEAKAAGFERSWDGALRLYAKHHPQAEQL